MVILNEIDRFYLAGDAIDRLPELAAQSGHFKQFLRDQLLYHKDYIRKHGKDIPEVSKWTWLTV